MKVLSICQIREFDRIAIDQFGIPSIVLMENAARSACDELDRFTTECEPNSIRSIVILCGAGNNGGDGLVMARHLYLRGWKVKVVLLAEPQKLSQDAGCNLRILRHTNVRIIEPTRPAFPEQSPLDALSGFTWVVDAMLGTGTKLPLREPYKRWVEASNRHPSLKMAVDIPTGLPGEPSEESDKSALKQMDDDVFKADLTVSFVAAKPIMVTDTGKAACGRIKIVDIGAPPEVFQVLDEMIQGE